MLRRLRRRAKEQAHAQAQAQARARAQAEAQAQARRSAEESLRQEVAAEEAAKRASSAAYTAAVMDVAKGAIDRSRASAEFVQKAATAVFALYTGALTLSFSVTDRPLPVRGILPSVFLGLAIVLATAYLAFLTRGGRVHDPKHADGREQAELERMRTFLEWTRASVLDRGWTLRSAVVALAVGVIVFPAPFLQLPWESPPGAGSERASCTPPLALDDLSQQCVAPWPEPPQAGVGEPALRALLYETQLAEAGVARAEARAVSRTPGPEDTMVLGWAGAIGLALVAIPGMVAGGHTIRTMWRGRSADGNSDERGPTDTVGAGRSSA